MILMFCPFLTSIVLRKSTDVGRMLLKGSKKDFLKLLKAVVAVCEDKILFLSNKQANFFVVSKFCVEVVSRNFAVFLMAYGVSQLLMHILVHWLTA